MGWMGRVGYGWKRCSGRAACPPLSALGGMLFIINFFYSAFKGRRVTNPNPRQAATLEWTTPIHPPHGNWPGEIPEVHRWPYDYSKDGRDCIPQTEPPELSHKLVKNPA